MLGVTEQVPADAVWPQANLFISAILSAARAKSFNLVSGKTVRICCVVLGKDERKKLRRSDSSLDKSGCSASNSPMHFSRNWVGSRSPKLCFLKYWLKSTAFSGCNSLDKADFNVSYGVACSGSAMSLIVFVNLDTKPVGINGRMKLNFWRDVLNFLASKDDSTTMNHVVGL
jgi:hypothetical protein